MSQSSKCSSEIFQAPFSGKITAAINMASSKKERSLDSKDVIVQLFKEWRKEVEIAKTLVLETKLFHCDAESINCK